MLKSSANKTISSITRKISGKTVTITATSKSKPQETVTAAREQFEDITSSPSIELHFQLFQHQQRQSQQIIETLPISMDTTADDIINCIVDKHGDSLLHSECSGDSSNSSAAVQSLYLKKCIDSDTGIYRKVLDRHDNIMECLIKQQKDSSNTNSRLSFELCKHEERKWEVNKQSNMLETPSKGQTQLQQQQNVSDLCFFSPPHVTEITDRSYRRRNSLPSYICSSNYKASTATIATSDKGDLVVSDTPNPKNKKLKSLSEVMKDVVTETECGRQYSLHSSPYKNRRCSSDTTSPTQIRHLVSSPFVSPEKLYPKFVYTPMISATRDKGSGDQLSTFPDPVCDITQPLLYSLDTSRGNGNSPGTPSSDTSSPSPSHFDKSVNESSVTKTEEQAENIRDKSLPVFDDSLEKTPEPNDSTDQLQTTPSKLNNNTNNSTLLETTSSPVSKEINNISIELNDVDMLSQTKSDMPTSCDSPPTNPTATYDISSTGLVSPSRRQSLLQEATAHVLRRRSSARLDKDVSKSLTPSTVSESELNRTYLQLNKQKGQLSRQTSTPGLISPARYDMLIRKASQRVRAASAKRKSLMIVGNDDEAATEQNTETKQVQ